MAATYDPTLATDLDRMRDALGDVNVEAPFAPDETYLARLNEAGSWRIAAAAMARSFAARAINDPSSFTAVGDMSVSWNDRASAWLRIASALESEAARDTAAIGGFWSADVERGDLAYGGGEYSNPLMPRRK